MQDNLLFEYAVIRIVPQVEREEFINVGVILFCTKQKFLDCKIHLDEERIRHFSPSVDIQDIVTHVDSFRKICTGGPNGGPIGKLTLAERFRWLTATRSTVVQTSRVHPGLCKDPGEMLSHLFEQLVAFKDAKTQRPE